MVSIGQGNSTSSPPSSSDTRATRAGKFGMWLFLVSLSMLFAGSFIGYLVVRLRAESWRTADMPALPWGLWLSTVILLCASFLVHRALQAARRDSQTSLRRLLIAAFILGVAFLANQTINWLALIAANLPPQSRNLYAFTFYMLTGLHAAHVIGGLIQLGIVTGKAFRGRYSRQYHPGVTYAMMYWHFLDIVWLVMFGVMLLLT